MTCAGDNTVAALLAGALDATAARELERHLDACDTCRGFVASLGRGLSALSSRELPCIGDRVGRYTLRRVIGVGGMGVVYEAIDAMLDRRVALKLVRPDFACDPHALLAEARAMARLSHRNIVAIHDVGTSHGQLYLCMEYIAGTTLRDWLGEPRTRREILAVFEAAGRGLAYVHREGLVHLDFKPDNVLVDRSGRVVVTDFGVAALLDHASATLRVAARSGEAGPFDHASATLRVAARSGEAGPFDHASATLRVAARSGEAGPFDHASATLRVAARSGEAGPFDHASATLRVAARSGEAGPFDHASATLRVAARSGEAGPFDHARGRVAGTPAYMAPEQRRGGHTDARADQYAFCIALAQACGARMPAWLRDVIDRGTRESPDARFATMDDLLAALARGAGRMRRRVGAVLAVAAAASVAIVAARGPRTVTTVVDRPVIERVPVLVDDRAAPEASITPAEVALDAAAAVARADSERSRAARMLALASSIDRRVPERALVFTSTSIAARSAARLADHDRDDTACDDGGELACATEPPWCPTGTTLALQAGCWTCADERTCASLGTPHTCDDGSPLRCSRARPACTGRLVASVRGGCWECADPFACTARSWLLPVLGTATGTGTGNGNGSGGNNNGSGGNGHGSGGNANPTCGNGMCELGEDHASCPADCCESSGSGGCAAVCGNGMCEFGEDHTTCPSDCCEMTGSGACAPVCGNGMCEAGEDHASCPGDCCAVDAHGACMP